MEDKDIEKYIKKSIARGIKYLRKYRLKVVEEEKNTRYKYDGGATILLCFLQSEYGIDFGFNNYYGNLLKCAQTYSIRHSKPIFNQNDNHTDLFETNFLCDIYLQKYTKYTIKDIIQKMEQYLQSGRGLINQLMPLLGLTEQREMRYLNVGLGLVGLIMKSPEKILNNKYFKHLKKRVVRELADIFNTKDMDPMYVSITKSYALFLLILLNEENRIEDDILHKFMASLLKTQNSSGEWIYSDSYDTINEINNTILTIFTISNLLNYYNKFYNPEHQEINTKLETENETMSENENNPNEKNIDYNSNKKKMIEEGFAGGFLTPDNMDNLFTKNKMCLGSVIEMSALLVVITGTIFAMFYLYKKTTKA